MYVYAFILKIRQSNPNRENDEKKQKQKTINSKIS